MDEDILFYARDRYDDGGPMSEWNAGLEGKIRREMETPVAAQSTSSLSKSAEKEPWYVRYRMVWQVFLVVMLIGALAWIVQDLTRNQKTDAPATVTEPTVAAPIESSSLDVEIAAVKLRDRLTLMAILQNHNLVVIKNDYPRNELIFVNKDWTIDRLPDRLNMTEENREFISQFLKKN